MPSDFPAVVGQLLADYLAAPPSDPVALEHAIVHGALPVGYSLESLYLLRPAGDVLVVGGDGKVTADADPRRVRRVLVWGADRYPDLRALLPARPPGAPDCPTCGGTGRYGGAALCWECGGLGWQAP